MKSLFALLTRYSMVWILIGLCVVFSLATIDEQPPGPEQGARQIASQVPSGDWPNVLAIGSTSAEDTAFVAAVNRLRPSDEASRDKDEGATVIGTPQDARRVLDQWVADRRFSDAHPLLLVLGPDARGWKLFQGLSERFPTSPIRILVTNRVIWPNFLKANNLVNIANQIVVIAILAVGMTLVILTGGIDLSVGSLIALSAVLCTLAIRDWGGAENATTASMVACGLAALAVCGACGLANGILTQGFGIPPFIATLGMMLIASGFAFILSQGQSIDAVPENFVWLGRGTLAGIPIAVAMMLFLYAVAQGLMVATTYGRSLYAIGGNAEAARLCGIRVRMLTASTYVLSAVLAGLGGLVMASRLRSGDAKYGSMYELYVIAAVVVGGTSLRGGYGSVLGTLVGALIIAVIENGMNLVQIESYTQKVVFGFVILIAVLLDRHSRRGR
jgi:ribose transport system permease protein